MRWWRPAGSASAAASTARTVETVLEQSGLQHHIATFQSEAITFEMLADLTAHELQVELGLLAAECTVFMEHVLVNLKGRDRQESS